MKLRRICHLEARRRGMNREWAAARSAARARVMLRTAGRLRHLRLSARRGSGSWPGEVNELASRMEGMHPETAARRPPEIKESVRKRSEALIRSRNLKKGRCS